MAIFLLEDVYNELYGQVQFPQATIWLPHSDDQIQFEPSLPLVQPKTNNNKNN